MSVRRREFIVGAAAAMSTVLPGQAQGSLKRLALVHTSEPPEGMTINGRRTFKAFFAELAKLGYVEGTNLVVERYSALGRQDNYAGVARAIVDSRPDLIVSLGGPMARQLKPLTSTIPIVTATSDPVVAGYAKSLAKPGGNLTGVSVDAGVELYGKRLQLLREVVQTLTKVRLLIPPSNVEFWRRAFGPVQLAAREISISIELAVVTGDLDQRAYEETFEGLAQERVDGLLIADAAENITYRQLIADLAARHRLPAIYPYRDAVEQGGLMSYGVDLGNIMRQLADIAVQILKGAKPSETPFYQPTKFELVLNRAAAQRLGLEFRSSLLATADEVIE